MRLQMSEDASGNYTCSFAAQGGVNGLSLFGGPNGCLILGFGGGDEVATPAIITLSPELTGQPDSTTQAYPAAAAYPLNFGYARVGFTASGAQSGTYDIVAFQSS